MTYGGFEYKVRVLVNDTVTPYRFATDVVRGFIRDAVLHLRDVNASERYGGNGLLDDEVPPVPQAASDGQIRVSPSHEEAVVKYAAARVYELDITDTVNMQVSDALMAKAEALMRI